MPAPHRDIAPHHLGKLDAEDVARQSGVRRVAGAQPGGASLEEDECARSITRDLLGILNSLDRVPVIVCSTRQLSAAGVDERQIFILGFVDGGRTIEAVIEESALPTDQVLLTIGELLVHGVIAFRI